MNVTFSAPSLFVIARLSGVQWKMIASGWASRAAPDVLDRVLRADFWEARKDVVLDEQNLISQHLFGCARSRYNRWNDYMKAYQSQIGDVGERIAADLMGACRNDEVSRLIAFTIVRECKFACIEIEYADCLDDGMNVFRRASSAWLAGGLVVGLERHGSYVEIVQV